MNTKLESLVNLLNEFEFVDLSPTLESGIPKWPTHPPVIVDPTITHEHDGYYCQTLIIGEHSGAHIDSPAHILPEMMANTIETYPLQSFFGRAVVYDLSRRDNKPGERIPVSEFLSLEEKMGVGAFSGDVVLINFGWGKYWSTGKAWKYYATNAPGMDEDAVKLFSDRKVKAVGTDTIACDTPVDNGNELFSYGHRKYWLPNHIFIMEMLMNLALLPSECYFLALPLKIRHGSGSPIRPLALVPRNR
ncbi:MAG: hypothetical protein SAMD01599839_09550 [Rectinema sp.]|jgi:arylformamidase